MRHCAICKMEGEMYDSFVTDEGYKKVCKRCVLLNKELERRLRTYGGNTGMDIKMNGEAWGNLKKELERVQKEQVHAYSNKLVKAVNGSKQQEENKPKEEKNELMEDINKMIGQQHFKNQIKDWIDIPLGAQFLSEKRDMKISMPCFNMMITGEPGTGKTIFARKLAKLFHQAGLLRENKIIEVQAEDLIGQHVGHTGKKTQGVIDKAKGGVLFLDEAYRLAGDGFSGNRGSYGLEALEVIMGAMEKWRGHIIFILAGYEDRMQDLFKMNDGLRSRIPYTFNLTDYTPEELNSIAEKRLTDKGYDISEIKEEMKNLIIKKSKNGILAGNGRTIRVMCDKIIINHTVRIGKERPENVTTFKTCDLDGVLGEERKNEDRKGLEKILEDAKKELNDMVGLENVKNEVKRILNFQMVQNKRKEKGLKVQVKSNHMIFKGSPGTGKTTVARLVAKALRGAGVLSNGHLVEVTKDELTISRGKTSEKVKKVVGKAVGGVLFVDEAYTLAQDSVGREVIDTLITEMEENRDNLIVIFAGYTDKMDAMLKVNEGLSSRIPTHISFEDYNAKELSDIALKIIEENEYILTMDAKYSLVEKIEELSQNGVIEGNGRWVRNLFEKILVAQSDRIVEKEVDDMESLQTLEEIDILDGLCEMEVIQIEDVPEERIEDKNFGWEEFRDLFNREKIQA